MMKRALIVLIVLVAIAAAVVFVWRRTFDDPVSRAASLAGNDDQARLWNDVASAHTRAAVERLAAPQPTDAPLAVTPARLPVQAPPQQAIPPNVVTTIRIVSTMSPGLTEFAGRAIVSSVDKTGEQIVLMLAPKRELTIAVKVNGKPLGLSVKEVVDVYLKWQPGRIEREQVIAVRTQAGIEVASMVLTGRAPVTLKVALPSGETLIATQTGPTLNGSRQLTIELPGVKDTIDIPSRIGSPADRVYGGRALRVLGSFARAPGSDGAPYGVDIITWRLK
jgi:hypothetical protein